MDFKSSIYIINIELYLTLCQMVVRMISINVYLDTCIVSETYKGTIKDEDFNALDVLSDMDRIKFLVSDVMKEELYKIKDDSQRKSLAVLYKIFSKCTRHTTVHRMVVGAYGRMAYGRGSATYDPLYASIKNIFTQKDKDPEHIFQAVKNGCDYFLTVDYKTILKKAEKHKAELEKICPNIKFVSPSTLLDVLKKGN